MNTADCGCPTDGEFIYHRHECPIRPSQTTKKEKPWTRITDAELSRLRSLATRWYLADGTWETLPEEEVIRRRKEAAKVLEAAKKANYADGNPPELYGMMEWIADRMVRVYGEDENSDFVRTIREKGIALREVLFPLVPKVRYK